MSLQNQSVTNFQRPINLKPVTNLESNFPTMSSPSSVIKPRQQEEINNKERLDSNSLKMVVDKLSFDKPYWSETYDGSLENLSVTNMMSIIEAVDLYTEIRKYMFKNDLPLDKQNDIAIDEIFNFYIYDNDDVYPFDDVSTRISIISEYITELVILITSGDYNKNYEKDYIGYPITNKFKDKIIYDYTNKLPNRERYSRLFDIHDNLFSNLHKKIIKYIFDNDMDIHEQSDESISRAFKILCYKDYPFNETGGREDKNVEINIILEYVNDLTKLILSGDYNINYKNEIKENMDRTGGLINRFRHKIIYDMKNNNKPVNRNKYPRLLNILDVYNYKHYNK